MKTRTIMLLLCLFPALTSQHSENRSVYKIEDTLHEGLSFDISGYTGDKLDLAYKNRIMAQDIGILVDAFRNRAETSCWQSEFWGKWMTSAVLACRYHPTAELETRLDSAVSGLLSTQSPDGYIGNYSTDHRLEAWDIWGRKYCMLGLLAYYDLTGDEMSLNAIRALADLLIEELQTAKMPLVRLGNHRGMAASSVLEPICRLYVITREQRYLNFAGSIVEQWETVDGPQLISKSRVNVSQRFPKPVDNWYGWEQGQKAYEMMSCYEGLLELYRLTGNEDFKNAAVSTWQNIRDTEINIAGSGASKECWFEGRRLQTLPVHHYQETCVTATWIKLSYQLLRLTGEAEYADAIEQSFYNALLGGMHPDGSDWAKYSPLSGQRMKGTAQCNMGLNCCVASGPRALFLFPFSVVMSSGDGIQVNFFASGSYTLLTPKKQRMVLKQITTYPADGKVTFRISLPKNEVMTIKIRKPGWAEKASLKINGLPSANSPMKQFFTLKQEWKDGDSIELWLDMPGKVIVWQGEPDFYAIQRGPVVFSRDARLPGPPVDANIIPVQENGYLELVNTEPADKTIGMQVRARFIPESYAEEGSKPVEADLCDYASAGSTYDERSWFRTWFPVIINPSEE